MHFSSLLGGLAGVSPWGARGQPLCSVLVEVSQADVR